MAQFLTSPITTGEECIPPAAAAYRQRRAGNISGCVIVEARPTPTILANHGNSIGNSDSVPRYPEASVDDENSRHPAHTWNPDPQI
jgi:hypothetical protein